MTPLTGTCLCGAVTVRVEAWENHASACHCRMCRVWTGAAMWGFAAPAAAVSVAGPVKAYRSSDFARRAFCVTCGTHLWIRDDGGDYDLVPGLFEAAREMPITREVYGDQAFACVPLAGDHARLSKAEYEKTHMAVEDGA